MAALPRKPCFVYLHIKRHHRSSRGSRCRMHACAMPPAESGGLELLPAPARRRKGRRVRLHREVLQSEAASPGHRLCQSYRVRKDSCPRLNSTSTRPAAAHRSQRLPEPIAAPRQRFGWRSPAERLARPAIERRSHGREVIGAVRAQVGALREVLPQQPIGVLVRAALPRAVRVAEVHLHAGVDPQPRMLAISAPWSQVSDRRSCLRQGGDRAGDGVAHRFRAMPGQRRAVLDAGLPPRDPACGAGAAAS